MVTPTLREIAIVEAALRRYPAGHWKAEQLWALRQELRRQRREALCGTVAAAAGGGR